MPMATNTTLRVRTVVYLIIDTVHEITDGAYAFEFFRRDPAASVLTQFNYQVNGVDAVEVQVLE